MDNDEFQSLQDAFQRVVSTPDGQLMLSYLIRKFGFTSRTTFVPNDPQSTAYQEGQRSVIVEFSKVLEARRVSPDHAEEVVNDEP